MKKETEQHSDLSSDTEILWAEAINFAAHTTEDTYEAGRRFIALKSRLGHGKFGQELKKRDIGWSRVCEIMLISSKLAKFPDIRKFQKSKQLLLAGRVSDDELRQLEETGELHGRNLEEMQGMTYAELQEAFRQSQDKNEKLDDANRRLKAKQEKDERFYNRTEKKQEKTIRRVWEMVIAAIDLLEKIRIGKASEKIQSMILGALSQIETYAGRKKAALIEKHGLQTLEPSPVVWLDDHRKEKAGK